MLSIVSENLLSEYYLNSLAHKELSRGQVLGYLRIRNLKLVVSLEVGPLAVVMVVNIRASPAVHTHTLVSDPVYYKQNFILCCNV
jgi:hypothetical protein